VEPVLLVEPPQECRRPPVPLAEQLHGRGHEQGTDERGIDDDGDRETDSQLVFALDALARAATNTGDSTTATMLLDEADARMGTASHFISERDRVDAKVSRAHLA
jgi:hypothetical protein